MGLLVWLNRRCSRVYWDGWVSRSEFEEFRESVLDQFGRLQRANEQSLVLFKELKGFRDAQGALNLEVLKRIGGEDLIGGDGGVDVT